MLQWLATLLEGAGCVRNISKINKFFYGVKTAVKLDFVSENDYINASGVILCEKSGQSTSILAEIVKNKLLYGLADRPLLVKCYDIKKVKSPG